MEVATIASSFAINNPTLSFSSPSRTVNPIRSMKSSYSVSSTTSLSTQFIAPFAGSSTSCSAFSGHKLRPSSLNPASFPSSNRIRGVVTMVIPFSRGSAWEQPPPDLASYLYKNRIVYLGMSLVPSVTELILAEFLYLQYEDAEKPIFLYINSTGTTKGGEKLGYETEAFAIYDVMSGFETGEVLCWQCLNRHCRSDLAVDESHETHTSPSVGQQSEWYVKPPIFTLCVGNAWGEAALLLAAGAKGNRSALPSSTIMIRQPIGRFQGQATDVNLARKEVNNVKTELVNLYAKHMEKTPEQMEADIQRPKYFSPSEAVEYGIIDKVIYNERGHEDRGVVSDLKKAQLI